MRPTLRDVKIATLIAVTSSLFTLIVTFTAGSYIEHGLLLLAGKFAGASASANIITEQATPRGMAAPPSLSAASRGPHPDDRTGVTAGQQGTRSGSSRRPSAVR